MPLTKNWNGKEENIRGYVFCYVPQIIEKVSLSHMAAVRGEDEIGKDQFMEDSYRCK